MNTAKKHAKNLTLKLNYTFIIIKIVIFYKSVQNQYQGCPIVFKESGTRP